MPVLTARYPKRRPMASGEALAQEMERLGKRGDVPGALRTGVILTGDMFARLDLHRRGASGDPSGCGMHSRRCSGGLSVWRVIMTCSRPAGFRAGISGYSMVRSPNSPRSVSTA